MAYHKYRTLNDTLSTVNPTVRLPRDTVIDALLLRCQIEVTNGTGSSWTGTHLDMLKALEEIRVISDGTNVHYALNGPDIAMMNAYTGAYGGTHPGSDEITIANTEAGTVDLVLPLNEGDILAVTKDSLELKAVFASAIAADLDVTDISITPTISENVYTPQEFAAMYGAELERSAEPKCYALGAQIGANTELTGVLDLPTSTLLRRGVCQFRNGAGVLGAADPLRFGLIVTAPDRRELLNVNYATFRGMQNFKYTAGSALPVGTVSIDYASEVTGDGFGLRGWRWTKGDYELAVRTNNAGSLRYVSCEHVVTPEVFEAIGGAVLEGRPGF